MKKIPQDMLPGNVYTHDKYGDYEVVEYHSSVKVYVRFLLTDNVVFTRSCHIRDGLVRDPCYIPEKFKIGSRHKTNHGPLVVTSYDSHDKVGIKFIKTGCEKVVRGDYVTEGTVTDYLRPTVYGVGYLGSENKRKTKIEKLAHKRWSHMLERCYSERWHKAKPTYEICEVCDDWKDLSVFTRWFIDNYPDDGREYHLDKDIKIQGNKIYSPEACIFVSPEDNSMHRCGTLNKYFVLSHNKHGIRYVRNLSNLAREFGVNQNGFSYLVNGHKKTYHGWKMIRYHYTPYLADATL